MSTSFGGGWNLPLFYWHNENNLTGIWSDQILALKYVLVIVCFFLGAGRFYFYEHCSTDRTVPEALFHFSVKSSWSIIDLSWKCWNSKQGWWAHEFLLMLLWNSACVLFPSCRLSLMLMKCWFQPHVLRNAGKLQRIGLNRCLSWAVMNGREMAWSGFLENAERSNEKSKQHPTFI